MSSNGIIAGDNASYDDTSVAKRRRIALSCQDCRRRKLRCDRLFPSCSRCQKSGHPGTCTYDSEAVEVGLSQSLEDGRRDISSGESSSRIRSQAKSIPRLQTLYGGSAAEERDVEPSKHQPPEDTCSRLHAQDERIRQLENRIILLENATHGPHPHHPARSTSGRVPGRSQAELNQAQLRDTALRETMSFRGKGFKTQFYGVSHDTSYLSQLPELRLFMKDMMTQHLKLAHMQQELRSIKVKNFGQDDDFHTNHRPLAKLLPHREATDPLVHLYVDNLERTHRLLHLPSFWAEYNAFWVAPNEARPAFVVLLLLILAATKCMEEKRASSFRGLSSINRETAIMWIRECDSWLSTQSQKHVTITTFQSHCVSFIAKQLNSINRKRTWASAGSLLRLAISAGLHRDTNMINPQLATSSHKKVSTFDMEMRKRIWATISELELQAALERGMPAMTRDLLEDCGAPSNLEDEGFDQSTDQLPESRPLSQFTRSSYQHLAKSSHSVRLELASLVNGPNSGIPYEDVLLYDNIIMQHLDDVPNWNGKESLVPQILLQVQLKQFLLLLHRPYARNVGRSSRYGYSSIICMRSAIAILELHHQLTSTTNLFLCLFRNDVLGAALTICQDFCSPRSSLIPSSGDPIHYIRKALDLLETKIMCHGVGLQEYYCVCAIEGLVNKRLSAENPSNEEQVAADRVCQIMQRMLALQDNSSATAISASLSGVPVVDQNRSSEFSNENDIALSAPIDNPGLFEDFGQDLDGLDLTNFEGWDLDAFWNL